MEFTPDEIRITAENKFDDGIYQLLYGVWKETSGEYDPKDDKSIVDPRGNVHTQNETKFKYWAMEQYGMTSEEYRGYTIEGTLKTLGEIDETKDKVLFILALPSIAKNAVKTVKDVAENGVHFDTSIGFAAGNDGKKQVQNAAGDVVEETADDIASAAGRSTGGNRTLTNTLTDAQKSRLNALENTINDHLTEGDFSGTLRDLQGNPVPNGRGGYFDHLGEMRDSYKSLQKIKRALEGSLKNPNLSDIDKRLLQEGLDKANLYITRIDSMAAPYGGIK